MMYSHHTFKPAYLCAYYSEIMKMSIFPNHFYCAWNWPHNALPSEARPFGHYFELEQGIHLNNSRVFFFSKFAEHKIQNNRGETPSIPDHFVVINCESNRFFAGLEAFDIVEAISIDLEPLFDRWCGYLASKQSRCIWIDRVNRS